MLVAASIDRIKNEVTFTKVEPTNEETPMPLSPDRIHTFQTGSLLDITQRPDGDYDVSVVHNSPDSTPDILASLMEAVYPVLPSGLVCRRFTIQAVLGPMKGT